ncbi:MAG TPA: tetratricopeptide repeat protein, partial [Steroidobacteraceae bacterium]
MAETKHSQPPAEHWHQLAVSAARVRNYEAALELMGRAIEANPLDATAFNDRGIVLKALRRFGDSKASFERAIALLPRYAAAHSNLGNLLREMRQEEAAFLSYQRALQADPACADAHANFGVLLGDLARWEESIAHFDEALIRKPGDAHLLCNRGVALERLGNLDEALVSYDRALVCAPDFDRVHANRGNVLIQLRRLDEAVQSSRRAIALSPELAAAHQNLGLVLLTLGRLEEGWQEYEWRLKAAADASSRAREFQAARFTGIEELNGRTIFIHSEQGLGDTLQFARYAAELSARGAHVILEVPAPLRTLFGCVAGVRVIAKGEPVPEFDLQCPLMSLPLAFGTTLSSIPSQVPYLRADGERVKVWGERLGEKRKPRVG